MSHPPPPPVDYVPPRPERRYPWRPLWLRLLLPLHTKALVRADESRSEQYEQDQRLLRDD